MPTTSLMGIPLGTGAEVLPGWAAVGVVVLARSLALTATGWGLPGLDVRTRIGLGLVIAGATAPIVGPAIAGRVSLDDPIGLGLAAAAEAAVGLGLGLAMSLIVGASRLAGDLVGVQAGLSPMSLLDPLDADAAASNPLGILHGWLAIAAFLAIGGPVIVIEAVIRSYQVLPAAAWRPDVAGASPLVEQAAGALALALRAASPVVVALLAAGVALTLLGRAGAGIGLLALSLPLRLVLGVLAVVATLAAAWSLYVSAWARVLWLGPGST